MIPRRIFQSIHTLFVINLSIYTDGNIKLTCYIYISRKKLLEITDLVMPDEAHKDAQHIIDEAITKVVSYQDTMAKRR